MNKVGALSEANLNFVLFWSLGKNTRNLFFFTFATVRNPKTTEMKWAFEEEKGLSLIQFSGEAFSVWRGIAFDRLSMYCETPAWFIYNHPKLNL